MTTQKRARKGGEIGPNGEHYNGGAFIATTTLTKLPAKTKRTGPRKVQVAPYEWVEPREGFRTIYSAFAGFERVLITGDFSTLSAQTVAYYGLDVEALKVLAARYAAGERWY